MREAKERATME
jgi:DNA repair protein RAD50